MEITPRTKFDCRRDDLDRRPPSPVGFFPGPSPEPSVDGHAPTAGEKAIARLGLAVPGRDPNEVRLAVASRPVVGQREPSALLTSVKLARLHLAHEVPISSTTFIVFSFVAS